MSSFLEVMGELKAALDEHDKLVLGGTMMQRSHSKGEAEFSEAAVGGLLSRGSLIRSVVTTAENLPKGKCGTESLPHTPCGDNPQVEEADIRNRLPDPMEEVEENHTADRIDVEPRAPSPPSTIQGGGGIGGS